MYLGEVCSLYTLLSSPLRLIDQSEPVRSYSAHPFILNHIEPPPSLDPAVSLICVQALTSLTQL